MNDKTVHGFSKVWSLDAFCVKAIKNDSQFGPFGLLYHWLCEEFWQCDSFDQCMLARGKKTPTVIQFTVKYEDCTKCTIHSDILSNPLYPGQGYSESSVSEQEYTLVGEPSSYNKAVNKNIVE